MNLKEALKQVFDNGVPASCNVDMEVELTNKHFVTPGPITHNVRCFHYFSSPYCCNCFPFSITSG
jgi:hypothetical protein